MKVILLLFGVAVFLDLSVPAMAGIPEPGPVFYGKFWFSSELDA